MAGNFSEWGAEQSGSRIFQQDQQAMQLNALKMQEAMGSLSQQPLHSRILAADAGKKEMELKNAQAMQEAMAKYTSGRGAGMPGQGPPPSGPGVSATPSPQNLMTSQALEMLDLAQIRLAGADVEGSRKLTATAMQTLSRANLMDERAEQQEKLKFETQEKKIESAIKGMEGIDSPEKWEQHKMLWMMNHPGQKPPAAIEQPYSPELIKGLVEGAMSQKDKLAAKYREDSLAQKTLRGEQRARFESSTIQLRKEAGERAKARNDVYVKLHGPDSLKPEKAATKNERDESRAAILLLHPELKDDLVGLNTASEVIAGDVNAAIRANPGMDRKTAVTRALAKRKDDFKTETSFFGSKSTKFSPPAGALPVPKTAAEAKVGQSYTLADGRVGKWTGKGFEVDDSEDDDEED